MYVLIGRPSVKFIRLDTAGIIILSGYWLAAMDDDDEEPCDETDIDEHVWVEIDCNNVFVFDALGDVLIAVLIAVAAEAKYDEYLLRLWLRLLVFILDLLEIVDDDDEAEFFLNIICKLFEGVAAEDDDTLSLLKRLLSDSSSDIVDNVDDAWTGAGGLDLTQLRLVHPFIDEFDDIGESEFELQLKVANSFMLGFSFWFNVSKIRKVIKSLFLILFLNYYLLCKLEI